MHQRRHPAADWELSLPPDTQPPSPAVVDLLTHGDPLRDPQQVAASVLLGLWNRGCTWDQAVRIAAGAPGLRDAVARPSRGLSWLWRVQRSCEQYASDTPDRDRAHQVRVALADAHRRAEVRQWPRLAGHRVSGVSVTRVLRAVLTIAGSAGRTAGLHLSVRTVAEQSGVSRGTAHSALRYLQAARVLTCRDGARVTGDRPLAATYALHLDVHVLPDDSPEDDHTVQPAAAGLLSHDAWRWGGLGGAAGHVWVLLSDVDGLTAEQVAALRGRSVAWTRRLLGRLSEHGLAVRHADTWTRCTVTVAQRRLDVAARHVGTAGAGEALRVKHAAERVKHAEGRADWLARRRQSLDDLRAPAGAVRDPATGTWVDLATGEVVQRPQTVVPPVPEPVGLTAEELQVLADTEREHAAQVSAEQRERSRKLADRLHDRLDALVAEQVQVVSATVAGQDVPLPAAGDPLVLDLTTPDRRDQPVLVTLQVPAAVLGLQQAAARLQEHVAAAVRPLQDLADRIAGQGRPWQDLTEHPPDTVAPLTDGEGRP